MAYRYGNRRQRRLLPPRVEECVPADAPVRAYDAIVDRRDLAALGHSWTKAKCERALAGLGERVEALLAACAAADEAVLGRAPEVICSDAGYVDYEPVGQIDRTATDVIVPSPQQAGGREPGPFDKRRFDYDAAADAYRCPAGQALPFRRTEENGRVRVYEAGTVCRTCPHLGDCTTSRARGRKVRRLAAEEVREALVDLRAHLSQQIEALEAELTRRALGDRRVELLLTHPGVGRLTALAVVHTLSPAERFARGRQVAAYAGLDPRERSSGDHRRYLGISKGGSKLLRFLLRQAAHAASRRDPALGRSYRNLASRRGKATATTVLARRIVIHGWIMLRDGIDYAEFRRRGLQRLASSRPAVPAAAGRNGPAHRSLNPPDR